LQRGRKSGRPGKDDRAMVNIPRIKKHIRIPFGIRHIRTAGLAGLVCGANIRPNLLESRGSCEKPVREGSRKLKKRFLGILVL